MVTIHKSVDIEVWEREEGEEPVVEAGEGEGEPRPVISNPKPQTPNPKPQTPNPMSIF